MSIALGGTSHTAAAGVSEADGVSNDGAMDVSWDRSVDAAYISLIPPDERTYGVVDDSVTLEDIADEAGIEALHLLVLDFDRDGKLIGNELLGARCLARVDLASSAVADCRNEAWLSHKSATTAVRCRSVQRPACRPN